MIRNSILTMALLLWGGASMGEADLPVFSIEELMGNINPARHKGFSKLPPALSAQGEHYLRKEAAKAFEAMATAAAKEGLSLKSVSATRNFSRQKSIWERKWDALEGSPGEKARSILTYSSMPGTSRHHWGTDLDINSVEPAYFETEEGQKVYAWLVAHASEHGFFQPYTAHAQRTGYAEEKWHWSYAPLARRYLFAFNMLVDYSMIHGFDGAETAQEIEILEHYVNGIQQPAQ